MSIVCVGITLAIIVPLSMPSNDYDDGSSGQSNVIFYRDDGYDDCYAKVTNLATGEYIMLDCFQESDLSYSSDDLFVIELVDIVDDLHQGNWSHDVYIYNGVTDEPWGRDWVSFYGSEIANAFVTFGVMDTYGNTRRWFATDFWYPDGSVECPNVGPTTPFTMPTWKDSSLHQHISYWSSGSVNYNAGQTIYFALEARKYGWSTEDIISFSAVTAYDIYIIGVDANGGTGSIADQHVNYHGIFTCPPTYAGITREHYNLVGWQFVGTSQVFAPDTDLDVPEIIAMFPGTVNGDRLTVQAIWEKKTYTISVSNGYYFSGSGFSVNLDAPGCTVTNSTLTQSNHTSIISHEYSTTPITITISRSASAWLCLYIDGAWHTDTYNSVSYVWTPNASHTLTWYIRETWGVFGYCGEGISGVSFKDTWEWGYSGTDYAVWIEGMPVEFTAAVKTGYVFDGWYDENGTRKSTDLKYNYGEVSTTVQMTAKATKIYDMIEYDSSGQYFYFEDGVFPQTYAGDSMNSTLNSWYSGKSTSRTLYINNISTNCYNYNGTEYARVKCPTTYTVNLKSGSSKTFSANSYYWFTLEPIRWRVSEYGVGIDYYSNTLYNKFVNDGCVNGVSQYVLDYAPIVSDLSKVTAGWEYSVDSDLHVAIVNNYFASSCTSMARANKMWDYIPTDNTNTKIGHVSLPIGAFHQVALAEMEQIGLTDLEAPVTDLTAMLSGTNYGKNLKYSTRDLFDNQNSRCVTEFGIVKNRWLDGGCGVRLAYSSTGKK